MTLSISMKKLVFQPVATASIVATALVLCVQSSAQSATFFGEDLGLGESVRLTSRPNADAARASFLSNLVGVGTETFEGFTAGTSTPLSVGFPGAGTATLSGVGSVRSVPTGTNGVGRYPISGDKFLETGSGFTLDFTNAIAAFGFYGVDIGDFNGQVTLELTNGAIETLVVPNSLNILGGSVLYFGYIADPGKEFTKIVFGNTAAGTDFFAFDDFTIGSRNQVTPNPVPTPALLPGLIGLGLGAWRKRKGEVAKQTAEG